MVWWGILIGFVAVILLLAGWTGVQYRRFRRDFPKPDSQQPLFHPNLDAWPDSGISATWIGHSTVYMNLGGIRVLSDPVFSARVGIRLGPFAIGPKRYTAPAVTIDEVVDKVDIILLSHAHLDHLDLPTLRRLANSRVQVVTAIGTGHLLRPFRFRRILELGGEGRIELERGVTIQAVPVRHWGRRFPWNKHYQWTGYVISHRGVRVFFSGDTAYTPDLASLAEEQAPIHLAILPIGAYAPDAFQGSHCTPEQAWSMFIDTRAEWLLPVHWNTFVLSQEPVDEPMVRLLKAAADESYRIVIRQQGEEFHLAEEKLLQRCTQHQIRTKPGIDSMQDLSLY